MSGKPLIVWSDPPPAKRGGRPLKHRALVDALKGRPGEWACLQRGEDRSVLQNMRMVLLRPAYQRVAHPYQLETAVRRTNADDFGLWARLTLKEEP